MEFLFDQLALNKFLRSFWNVPQHFSSLRRFWATLISSKTGDVAPKNHGERIIWSLCSAIKNPFQHQDIFRRKLGILYHQNWGPKMITSCFFFEDGQLLVLALWSWIDAIFCEMGVLSLIRQDARGDNPSEPGLLVWLMVISTIIFPQDLFGAPLEFSAWNCFSQEMFHPPKTIFDSFSSCLQN